MLKHEDRERPIGIFDSGVGGLTVVKEVIAALPGENIIYFGDTARVPYGSKSQELVTSFSKQILNFLLTKNVKAVIIACNTASALSYDALIQAYEIPIIEMVRPTVNVIANMAEIRTLGVIGTEMTIKSDAYGRHIRQQRPDITVNSVACPLFVPLAEEGWTDNAVAELTAREYLSLLNERGIDALILGCTHYPLLSDCVRRVVPHAKIINPAAAAAAGMKDFLESNGQDNLSRKTPEYTFFVSDGTTRFNDICKRTLGFDYRAQIVNIEEY